MTLLLFTCLLAADPTPSQAELLRTFREEFVAIHPGVAPFPKSFTMGRADGTAAERPTCVVSFDYHFAVAKYEVPQNLWESVMGSNPSRWKGPRNSVEMLSFDEAQEFCRKVTELMRAAKLIDPQQVVRLPSEAEWEYATRAGTETRYSFGDDVALLDAFGWHTGNAAGNDPPVGAKKPNPWGLYDVHGYLWEWCADAWQESHDAAPTDGSPRKASGDASPRVLRGGSWKDTSDRLSSSFRISAPQTSRDDAVGLRCVLAEAR